MSRVHVGSFSLLGIENCIVFYASRSAHDFFVLSFTFFLLFTPSFYVLFMGLRVPLFPFLVEAPFV